MTPLVQGVVSGAIFGGIAVATMLPMKFRDKNAALSAAFLNRFSIGLVIPLLKSSVAVPSWLIGLGVGVLLSLSDAIITKAYAPIIVMGAIGGVVIGVFA